MSGRYLTELGDWLRGAGLTVIEFDGWQTRARNSGGFDGDRPWCVMLHHTASNATAASDANYCAVGDPDAPICNLVIGPAGECHLIAAGATNTNGKGRATPCSRGTVPADQMNTHAVGIELSNNGIGEPYTAAQIDAMFAATLAIQTGLGLATDDCHLHHTYAPDRKIDPATDSAVQGAWQPAGTNTSGSWARDDVTAELMARAGHQPGPAPGPPLEGDDMLICALDANGTAWVGDGMTRQMIADPGVFDRYVLVHRGRFINTSGQMISGWPDVGTADGQTLDALGRAVV